MYFEGWEPHILQMGCVGGLLGPAGGWLSVVVVVAEDIFRGASAFAAAQFSEVFPVWKRFLDLSLCRTFLVVQIKYYCVVSR